MRLACLLFVLILIACGSAPALTAADVVSRFTAAGLDATNVRDEPIPDTAPIPHSYTSHANFTVPSAGLDSKGKTRGGQIFTCDSRRNCDAIYTVFDALKALGGPYYWQSPSGVVIVQMNSKIPAEIAAKYEAVVRGLP